MSDKTTSIRCTEFHQRPPTIAAPAAACDPRYPAAAYRSHAAVTSIPSLPKPPSSWVRCRRGGNQERGMVLQQRTPLMVASTYRSLDMMRLIVAAGSAFDVNRSSFPDGSTTLHCAASGGSLDAVEAVRMRIAAGADITTVHSGGHRPLDVVVSPPKLQSQKLALSKLLASSIDVPEKYGTLLFWRLAAIGKS